MKFIGRLIGYLIVGVIIGWTSAFMNWPEFAWFFVALWACDTLSDGFTKLADAIKEASPYEQPSDMEGDT